MNDELVNEVGEWAVENFGIDQPPAFPLIGAGEEAGELTRSVLKRAQGIDDSEKYADRDDVGDEAERDAIGDVSIYSADTIYRLRNDVGVDLTDPAVIHLLSFYSELGVAADRMLHDRTPEGSVTAALDRALIYLEMLAEERGFDYDECIADAWEEVSGREWDADVSV